MKNTKPKLYIIAGWCEKITRKNYQIIINSVMDKYNIVPIVYQSKKGVLFSEIINECKKQIIKPTRNDVIFGFSVGALIAFQLSGIFKFKYSIIASISALLENDLKLYPKSEVNKLFTKEEIQDMNEQKYLCPLSLCVLMYGTLETKELIKRSQKLHQKYGGVLISIAGQNHELKRKYLDQVLRQL